MTSLEEFLESKDTLDSAQLKLLLIDALDALKKKDSGRIYSLILDLIMAGEIGSRILEEKIILQGDIKRLKDKNLELERVVGDLENNTVQIEEEMARHKNLLNVSRENLDSLNKKYQNLSREFQTQRTEWNLKSENFNKKILLLKEEAHTQECEYDQLEAIYQSNISRLDELNNENSNLKQAIENSKSQVKELAKENSNLQESIKELTYMNSEIVDLRRDVEMQKSRIQVLEWENNQLNSSLSESQSRLGQFESGAGTNIVNSKSILSEIDEKRVKAEQEANQIHEKHQGLLKAHHVTVRQKERMKNHISRLTQLSQKQSAEHRVEILEAALSQALSDNQDLEHKLMNFSKNTRVHSDSDESSDGEGKSFISNLIMENTKLNQEIKTLHMLKLNEADKVRNAYSLLHLKEQELDQIRASFAQSKFELEEAILKLQNPDAFQVVDSKDIEELEDEADKIQLASDIDSSSPHCSSPLDYQEISETSMDNEQIQKVIQSLSGVSTPSSTCLVEDTSKSPTRKIKVDRSRVGQECNQQ